MTTQTKLNTYDALDRLMLQTAAATDSQGELEALMSYCLSGMDADSAQFLATLFLTALKKKTGRDAADEHIYLKRFEIPQIALFDILIEKFPFVKLSQGIINAAIIAEIRELEEVTLMDIGMGLGTQMKNIIELAKSLPKLKKMRVIGIEPFGDALEKASSMIAGLRSELAFELDFVGIHDFAEKVDYAAIPNLTSPLIVNASLALHHLPTQAQRMATIEKIKQLNPLAFILTEPNSNHFEPDFYKRFQNAYRHFYHIFQVIDQLEISAQDKNALKLFFGREIEDIIGNNEQERFEKHEPATHWIAKLKTAGFQLDTDFLQANFENNSCLKIAYQPEGFLGFTYENETVLAVIYAK